MSCTISVLPPLTIPYPYRVSLLNFHVLVSPYPAMCTMYVCTMMTRCLRVLSLLTNTVCGVDGSRGYRCITVSYCCTRVQYESIRFCNTAWKGRSVPFRHDTAQLGWTFRSSAYCQLASTKSSRLSAWNSPVVIFMRQRQALTLTRRQSSSRSSHRKHGRTNGTDWNVVMPWRNKRRGQKRKPFFTHTVHIAPAFELLLTDNVHTCTHMMVLKTMTGISGE